MKKLLLILVSFLLVLTACISVGCDSGPQGPKGDQGDPGVVSPPTIEPVTLVLNPADASTPTILADNASLNAGDIVTGVACFDAPVRYDNIDHYGSFLVMNLNDNKIMSSGRVHFPCDRTEASQPFTFFAPVTGSYAFVINGDSGSQSFQSVMRYRVGG
jgi:hypothetical protein